MPRSIHLERHRTERIGWLRAAVLGANDGIVSTASLIVGVAAANAGRSEMLVAGVAGPGGRCHVDGGGRVRVRQLAGRHRAGRRGARARRAGRQPEFERRELAAIYVARGLTPELATQVAEQLMAHDALGAHSRDELGMSDVRERAPRASRPDVGRHVRRGCGVASAHRARGSGATCGRRRRWHVARVSHRARCPVGGTGGAPVLRASVRVAFWGALAMGLTAVVGRLFGTVV